jgi:hypothetical protein
MKNPATYTHDGLNEFTTFVKENPQCMVKLRNELIVQPLFVPAEDDTCSDSFFTKNYSHAWDVNGKSVTNSDLDMMEICF